MGGPLPVRSKRGGGLQGGSSAPPWPPWGTDGTAAVDPRRDSPCGMTYQAEDLESLVDEVSHRVVLCKAMPKNGSCMRPA